MNCYLLLMFDKQCHLRQSLLMQQHRAGSFKQNGHYSQQVVHSTVQVLQQHGAGIFKHIGCKNWQIVQNTYKVAALSCQCTALSRDQHGECIAVPRRWNSAMFFFCQLHMERVTLQSTVFGGFSYSISTIYTVQRPFSICLKIAEQTYHTMWQSCDHPGIWNIIFHTLSD